MLINGETEKFSGWFCIFFIKIWNVWKIIKSLHFEVFKEGLKHCDNLGELETLDFQPLKAQASFLIVTEKWRVSQSDTEGIFHVPKD